MEIILFAIIFFILYFWVFSSTGAIVASVCRLRTVTNYTNLIIGCFTYFCIMSFAMMPLEFVYSINYVILIYYILAINLVYILTLLILIRWWFHIKLMRWEHLWFILALILFLIMYFLKDKIFTSAGNVNEWKAAFIGTDIISRYDILISNRPISSSITTGTNLWLANAGMWLLIFKGVSVDNLFGDIIFLIDPMLFAAFFVTIVVHFIDCRFSKLVTGIITLIFLLAVKLLLYYFGYDSWTKENMFYNLIIAILISSIIYYNDHFRMRFMPITLSLIIASYSAFDWSSTYLMLFVIYVFGWMSLFRFKINFLKDLLKFAFVPFFVFLIYNVVFGSIFLIFVFAALIVIMLIAITIFYRRYILVHNVEVWIFNHRKVLIFFVPIVFFFFAIILFLSSSNFDFSYWSFDKVAPSIYYQIKGLISDDNLSSVFIIVSFILLGLSIVWICIRDFTKNFQTRIMLDCLAILITTFFNPFTGRFLSFIFLGPALANNAALILTIILLLVVIAVASIRVEKVKNVLPLQRVIDTLSKYKLAALAKKRHKTHVKRYNNIKIKLSKEEREGGKNVRLKKPSAGIKETN